MVFNGVHEATEFEYSDPLNLRVDESKRDLQSFLSNEELASIAVDPDEGNGEIVINIPEAVRNDVKSKRTLIKLHYKSFYLLIDFGIYYIIIFFVVIRG